MIPLTARQCAVDSTKRTKALRELAALLALKPGVERTHVKSGAKQLAWVQVVQGRERLFCVFLNLYHPRPWRLTNKCSIQIPKVFWKGNGTGKLGSVGGFEWSFLPEEFDAPTVTKLFHTMANEGDAWDADAFSKGWGIFPKNERPHYTWSNRAKEFMDEQFRAEKEREKAWVARNAARLATSSVPS